MLSSSSRLLRVLSLLQTRSHWAGPELAERLAVHPRTLRRDIDRLRQLGYPIHASSGVAGGYAFRAGQTLPPHHQAGGGSRPRWMPRLSLPAAPWRTRRRAFPLRRAA